MQINGTSLEPQEIEDLKRRPRAVMINLLSQLQHDPKCYGELLVDVVDWLELAKQGMKRPHCWPAKKRDWLSRSGRYC
jgi:hypothetical protein